MGSKVATRADACALQDAYGREREVLIWVIYEDHPQHPRKYVAQPVTWFSGETLDFVLSADVLSGLLAMLPPGLVRVPPLPTDGPSAVERWV